MDNKEEDDDIVCLDESFFINDNYQLTTFTFGSHVLQLYCLQAASTDFDLTGQLVWPGAELLNDYLSENVDILQSCSAIELGSGVVTDPQIWSFKPLGTHKIEKKNSVGYKCLRQEGFTGLILDCIVGPPFYGTGSQHDQGITGILCSRYCRKVILTDCNDEVLKILKKNLDFCASAQSSSFCAGLTHEKLEWGNSDQINHILQENPKGFDLVLGADICFQQSSIPLLFDTVEKLLVHGKEKCKFILSYVSRAKVMDALVASEAVRHGLLINEVAGTRKVVRNLEGVIFEISLA